MEVTISGMMGKGSIRHNNRAFTANNVDSSRTSQNITICQDDLKEVYHQVFDDALAEYNSKKKKTRDKIPDYYEHIRQGKQEKLFHEVIFQLGDKDTCGCGTADGDRAAAVLKKFTESFQARNPQLKVFNATLHMDEATPHVHIDFVPVATGQKRGLTTRVSLKQALKQQGFQSNGRGNTEWQAWMESEKQVLADLAREHEIEIVSLGGGRRHMDLPEYRAAAQRLETVREQVTATQQSLTSLGRQQAEYAAMAVQARQQAQEAQEQVADLQETIGQLERQQAEYAAATEQSKQQSQSAQAHVEDLERRKIALRGEVTTLNQQKKVLSRDEIEQISVKPIPLSRRVSIDPEDLRILQDTAVVSQAGAIRWRHEAQMAKEQIDSLRAKLTESQQTLADQRKVQSQMEKEMTRLRPWAEFGHRVHDTIKTLGDAVVDLLQRRFPSIAWAEIFASPPSSERKSKDRSERHKSGDAR